MKLFLIAVILLLLELLYFRVADRLNIIDRPNERSSHKRVTLRGGGIIFLFGVWLYAAFYGLQYPWFLAGLTLIAAVSFADDVHSVPNKIRITVHLVAILLLFYQLGLFETGLWWYLLPAWIVCTGIINAYNFMDGINGITGGYSLAVLLPLAVVNVREPFVDSNLIWATVLSVSVFCWFNFRSRARCFAGDVGAISIAFILLFLLGALILQSGDIWYLVFLVVYGVDSVLTICHRLLLRENIFEAHRKHVYQVMANELKIPHVAVSSIYALLQTAISLGAIFLPVNRWTYFGVTVALLSVVYVLFKKRYYYLHEAYLKMQNNG